MEYTSAEANKLLRRLNEEREALLAREQKSCIYLASTGEEPESVKPEYDYAAVQNRIENLDEKIRIVKHAINQFNLTQKISEFDMTIDQMLIYIPQLTARKQKLARMKDRLPKQREMNDRFGRSSNLIDYSYANYDITEAEKDYTVTSEMLAKAQTALDVMNNTATMKIDI